MEVFLHTSSCNEVVAGDVMKLKALTMDKGCIKRGQGELLLLTLNLNALMRKVMLFFLSKACIFI